VRDPFTGQIVEQTAMTEVQIDEELLKGIAERTSGEFFRATDPESLRQIFARIDTLETSEIKQKSYRRYRELFFPFLVGAFALLLAAGSAYASGLRVAPA
jgi:Ca-activated chloride channel family protein